MMTIIPPLQATIFHKIKTINTFLDAVSDNNFIIICVYHPYHDTVPTMAASQRVYKFIKLAWAMHHLT